jgi:hypothetical protein
METYEVSYQPLEPQRRRPRRWGRIAAATALAGAVAGTLAFTHSQSSGTLGAASAAPTGATVAQTVAGTSSPGRGTQPVRPGAGGFGRFGGLPEGMGLTVTAVSGNTITASGPFSRTVTIAVTGATTYTEAGSSVTLDAVQKGEQIAVRGTRTSQGTLTATSIAILLPREGGLVSAINGTTITIKGRNGTAEVIHVSGSTRYQKGGNVATLNDVTPGVAISAEGTLNSDGTLTAQQVIIQLPRVMGQVTAVSSGTYTLTGRNGSTITVTTSGSTTYINPGGSSAQAPSITKGSFILAQGVLSADGKTLAATQIVVMPAAGTGDWGGSRMGRGGWMDGGMGVGTAPWSSGGNQSQSGSGSAGGTDTGSQGLTGSV